MRQPNMEAGLSSEHGFDNPINRLSSPGVLRSVMQPLEHKMYQYDKLMQEAHQQTAGYDEELRLLHERRFMAEERYMAAKAKHAHYEQQHQGVSRALHGEYEYEFPQRRPEPVHHNDHIGQVDTFDDEKMRLQPGMEMETPSKLGRREPSDHFTPHQLFYIFVLDGIGGMIVSGGINFGLAYAMYTTQNTVLSPIRLFQLPNTLAGDAAVTIIIQCIITWFIEKALVAHDLSHRGVQPIGFIPKPTRDWLRWWFFLPTLGYDIASDEEAIDEYQAKMAATGFLNALASVIQEALRGFLIAVVSFLLLWPASVGILIAFGNPLGGDYTYSDRWTPQIFKGILGGVLGLLTTPLMAMFWLIKAGWEGKRYRYPYAYKDGL